MSYVFSHPFLKEHFKNLALVTFWRHLPDVIISFRMPSLGFGTGSHHSLRHITGNLLSFRQELNMSASGSDRSKAHSMHSLYGRSIAEWILSFQVSWSSPSLGTQCPALAFHPGGRMAGWPYQAQITPGWRWQRTDLLPRHTPCVIIPLSFLFKASHGSSSKCLCTAQTLRARTHRIRTSKILKNLE